eukprot:270166-Rhodomonas_salina.2
MTAHGSAPDRDRDSYSDDKDRDSNSDDETATTRLAQEEKRSGRARVRWRREGWWRRREVARGKGREGRGRRCVKLYVSGRGRGMKGQHQPEASGGRWR